MDQNNNNNNNKIEKNSFDELTKTNSNNLKISNENNFNIYDNNNNEKQIFKNDKNEILKNVNDNKNEDESKIYIALSELNEYSPNNNGVKFDKNSYKKPEIYYPLKHEQYIIPQIKDYNKDNSPPIRKVRSFQQVINEKIKFANQLKKPNVNIISKNPIKSYENKMDDFFVKSTINNFKLQQRLKNNLNAYYDIGFPEELKADDLDPKF